MSQAAGEPLRRASGEEAATQIHPNTCSNCLQTQKPFCPWAGTSAMTSSSNHDNGLPRSPLSRRVGQVILTERASEHYALLCTVNSMETKYDPKRGWFPCGPSLRFLILNVSMFWGSGLLVKEVFLRAFIKLMPSLLQKNFPCATGGATVQHTHLNPSSQISSLALLCTLFFVPFTPTLHPEYHLAH